jgi:hypothetical protein
MGSFVHCGIENHLSSSLPIRCKEVLPRAQGHLPLLGVGWHRLLMAEMVRLQPSIGRQIWAPKKAPGPGTKKTFWRVVLASNVPAQKQAHKAGIPMGSRLRVGDSWTL